MPLRHKIESESAIDIPKCWSRVEEVSIYHPGQINAYGSSFCLKIKSPSYSPSTGSLSVTFPSRHPFPNLPSRQQWAPWFPVLVPWYLVSWLIITLFSRVMHSDTLCLYTKNMKPLRAGTASATSVCPQDLAVSFSQQKCVGFHGMVPR